ncbi:hypothetical protein FJV46_11440 [Arthrobacter agilis]|uniref:hypothetical protein n=1 Tax=Arthrobacter agilis TaxID=37921 RepID=UPI000F7F66AC|nr:hypothetical protein [Arthrobacter agilis]TPV23944.1 hypothetical protein FJV46_11440 [Arthrobacter agilis]
MTTSLTRTDLAKDIEALRSAYAENADALEVEAASAQKLISDTISLWLTVLSDEFDFLDAPGAPIVSDTANIQEHKETIENVIHSVRNSDARNIEIWCGYLLNTLRKYLRSSQELLTKMAGIARGRESDGHRTNLVAVEANRRSVEVLLARLEQIQLSYSLRSANEQASVALREARSAAEDARAAAGLASGSKLTERFAAMGRKHFWAATTFRVLTAVGVLGAIWGVLIVPSATLADGTGTDSETAVAILRVSLLAGALGLATYFGRQAAYHRDVSTWANTIKEQLLTFDGYVDPVDDPQLRDQMRVAFAARVFGSSPDSKDEPGLTLSSPLLSEVAAMFAKASPGGQRPV